MTVPPVPDPKIGLHAQFPGPRVAIVSTHPELVAVNTLDQDSIGIQIFSRVVELIIDRLENRDKEILALHAEYKRTERKTGFERPNNRIIEILVENFPFGLPLATRLHYKDIILRELAKAYPGATVTFLADAAPPDTSIPDFPEQPTVGLGDD